jgi:hypothetical protein
MCNTDSVWAESTHFEVGQSVCSTIGEFATNKRDVRGRIGPLRLRVPFLIERQLLAEEQVLRRLARAGREPQPNTREEVTQ